MVKYSQGLVAALSLLCVAGVPADEEEKPAFVAYYPIGTQKKFEYTLHAKSILPVIGKTEIEDAGSVTWKYRLTNGALESHFIVESDNFLVTEAINGKTCSIHSWNKIDDSPDKIGLHKYVYEEKKLKDRKLIADYTIEMRRTEHKDPRKSIDFDCNTGNPKKMCPMEPGSMDDPDIFAVLAGVAFVRDLEKKVVEGRWQPIFYKSVNKSIRLQRIADEAVEVGDKTIPAVKYDVENIGAIFDAPDVKMYLWLDKGFPHYMERATMKIPLKELETSADIIIQRKPPQKPQRRGKRRRR